MQLRKARIKLGKINHIFISHLHGDHIFGLYGLLSTFSLMGRGTPLHIYTPSKYKHILESHLDDFDIHLNFDLEFHGLSGNDPVMILDDKYLTVTSFPLKHRIPTYGFIFREKKSDRKIIKDAVEKYKIPLANIRSIKKGDDFVCSDGTVISNTEISIPPPEPLSYAYCSDTSYFKRITSFVKNVTVLYHESTFDGSKQDLASKTGHSTASDAANVALEAGVRTLIIGHFSARYRNLDDIINEARAIFPATLPATEGTTYDIGDADLFKSWLSLHPKM